MNKNSILDHDLFFLAVLNTFLTGDNLFLKLVAAVNELVGLPVSQKHFTTAHLNRKHTQYTRMILPYMGSINKW